VGWNSKEERNAYQLEYRRARGVKPRVMRAKVLCRVCDKPIRLQNRLTCSAECYAVWVHEQKTEAWLRGELNPTDAHGMGRLPPWIKRWWVAEFGECCSPCGWAERNPFTGKIPLEWDHIDGDCSNNLRANLRLLCPNCHALTETHASGNYGKSKRRRKWAGTVVIVRPEIGGATSERLELSTSASGGQRSVR
jgi:RNA polymerase subunit RPABC4/transcription elongation factor Spt4/predicted nucleic acid-binding Zn ribbon protein